MVSMHTHPQPYSIGKPYLINSCHFSKKNTQGLFSCVIIRETNAYVTPLWTDSIKLYDKNVLTTFHLNELPSRYVVFP